VALSGGVDSSVTAAVLQRDGWDVVGVTLVLDSRPGLRDSGIAERAARAAEQLGIEHHVIDCAGEFERLVLRPAWGERHSGRTPNPCVRCNERVKVGLMLDWALDNGCLALATGHYAKTRLVDGVLHLLCGADRSKDQTYFLAGLSQGQLRNLMFPLGEMGKQAVREMAAEMGLASAKSRESQDTCFKEPGLSPAETLRARFADGAASQAPGADGAASQAAAPASQAGQAPGADGAAPQADRMPGAPRRGHVVDWNGRRLAPHDGIHGFTVGQRRGVGVGTGEKAWVRRIDARTGDVHLTNREDDLLCSELAVSGLSWTFPGPVETPLECEVQVRYRSAPVAATLLGGTGGAGRVALRSPVRAAAPGQAAAFYSGDRVLGRGWIVDSG
jgi:tRNA-specific 2-thiouridylase